MMKLREMKNIGKTMEEKLNSIGVFTPEELIDMGSKCAYEELKKEYSNVCLVHLYTLEAAICDIEISELPENIRRNLKDFSDAIN
ncbi:DNA transformation protein [Breznakia sp. PF5-3]|uniref:TfoX/Sxy family DNA transformation protein n=1 Tax=unclassified Breznakia TaxID=2623764 RepID=UPI002406A74A|nr:MULTISPECIES: TfoX/Sxy family DNA transformation protein [unclassified Breznakia]MDF9824580.1 DNA transformation protein [Breznakia sp. PM6-1]MDF9835470.1 DNA transformation protein [Breznakia sp. PF5-3]MDF9837880.1 DNA transformation protein [Breznakia sp. PFB2-8]MDF9859827.1 DNA transformation protein [Breznakia sp. PH5-24]